MIFFYGVCFPSYPVYFNACAACSACDLMGDVLYLFNLFGCIFTDTHTHTILVLILDAPKLRGTYPKGAKEILWASGRSPLHPPPTSPLPSPPATLLSVLTQTRPGTTQSRWRP